MANDEHKGGREAVGRARIRPLGQASMSLNKVSSMKGLVPSARFITTLTQEKCKYNADI